LFAAARLVVRPAASWCREPVHSPGQTGGQSFRLRAATALHRPTLAKVTMDIDQFYDADPRRRTSDETEFGREWSDASGGRTELSWIADTGELYAMAEPAEPVFMDPVGDTVVPELDPKYLTVEVLGVIPDRARVDQLLAGWEAAMAGANSLQWVRDRLAQAGA
jgi:hypothetical protein